MPHNDHGTPATQSPLAIPEMVKLREASRRTNLSYDYLRKLCMSEEIVSIRAGNKYLVNLQSLVDFLNRGHK